MPTISLPLSQMTRNLKIKLYATLLFKPFAKFWQNSTIIDNTAPLEGLQAETLLKTNVLNLSFNDLCVLEEYLVKRLQELNTKGQAEEIKFTQLQVRVRQVGITQAIADSKMALNNNQMDNIVHYLAITDFCNDLFAEICDIKDLQAISSNSSRTPNIKSALLKKIPNYTFTIPESVTFEIKHARIINKYLASVNFINEMLAHFKACLLSINGEQNVFIDKFYENLKLICSADLTSSVTNCQQTLEYFKNISSSKILANTQNHFENTLAISWDSLPVNLRISLQDFAMIIFYLENDLNLYTNINLEQARKVYNSLKNEAKLYNKAIHKTLFSQKIVDYLKFRTDIFSQMFGIIYLYFYLGIMSLAITSMVLGPNKIYLLYKNILNGEFLKKNTKINYVEKNLFSSADSIFSYNSKYLMNYIGPYSSFKNEVIRDFLLVKNKLSKKVKEAFANINERHNPNDIQRKRLIMVASFIVSSFTATYALLAISINSPYIISAALLSITMSSLIYTCMYAGLCLEGNLPNWALKYCEQGIASFNAALANTAKLLMNLYIKTFSPKITYSKKSYDLLNNVGKIAMVGSWVIGALGGHLLVPAIPSIGFILGGFGGAYLFNKAVSSIGYLQPWFAQNLNIVDAERSKVISNINELRQHINNFYYAQVLAHIKFILQDDDELTATVTPAVENFFSKRINIISQLVENAGKNYDIESLSALRKYYLMLFNTWNSLKQVSTLEGLYKVLHQMLENEYKHSREICLGEVNSLIENYDQQQFTECNLQVLFSKHQSFLSSTKKPPITQSFNSVDELLDFEEKITCLNPS